MEHKQQGNLYIAGTPIGNLGDVSLRLQQVLLKSHLVLAEDTRVAKKLLQHLGCCDVRIISLHHYNEEERFKLVIQELSCGHDLVLLTDAGTPNISDPGGYLVMRLLDAGFKVVPIPGPSAVITALSCAGISADRFYFCGFLPAKEQQKQKFLEQLVEFPDPIVLFEAPHRIKHTLEQLLLIFGQKRQATVARELTKMHEQIIKADLKQLNLLLADNIIPALGEFTLVIAGAKLDSEHTISHEARQLLQALLTYMPLKAATKLVAEAFKLNANKLYAEAIKIKDQ